MIRRETPKRKKNKVKPGSQLAPIGSATHGGGGYSIENKGGKTKHTPAKGAGSYKPPKVSDADYAASEAQAAAISAITKYAAGSKTLPPTLAQYRTGWSAITPDVRKTLGPAILARASTQDPATADAKLASKLVKEDHFKALPKFLRSYNPEVFDAIAERNNLTLEKPINAGDAPIPGGSIIRGAVTLAQGGKAVGAAVKAEQTAAAAAKVSKPAQVAETVAKGTTKVGTGGKVASTVSKGKGAVAGSKVGKGAKAAAATKTAKVAGGTAKVGGKIASYPVAHPIKAAKWGSGAAVAAQAPIAIKEGDPGELLKPITEGTGVVPDLIAKARGGLDNFGVVGNAAADILELPTAVIPSTYLLGQALVKAAGGDSTELDAQLKTLYDTSLTGAVIKGDWEQAKTALLEHPIYSALEVSGAKAVVGRGAGAIARGGKAPKQREPLDLGGDQAPFERGRYSKDAINATAQKIADRRRGEGQKATPKETRKILNERADRGTAGNEGARRVVREAERREAEAARPKSDIDADAVSLATRNILRSAKTFQDDIADFARALDESYAKLVKQAESKSANKAGKAQVKMEANRDLRARLDDIAKKGNPEIIFESASVNAQALRAIDAELERVGLLDRAQGSRAALIPFARRHLGAKYGKANEDVVARAEYKAYRDVAKKAKAHADRAVDSERIGPAETLARIKAAREAEAAVGAKVKNPRPQLVDKDGNRLTTAEIDRRRIEMGAEEPGFVSLRPGQTERSANYVPSDQRPTLPKGALTGKAVDEGAFDFRYDTILEQRLRGRGRVSAADAFDSTIRDFQVGRSFEKGQDASAAARNPEKYGITPPTGQTLRVIRTAPLTAAMRELEVARRLQRKPKSGESDMGAVEDAVGADDLGLLDSQGLSGVWDQAQKLDGEGPFALIPETAFQRLGDHFKPPSAGFKAVQMTNQWFKSTVLAMSPKWVAGNVIDINLRAALSGAAPFGGIRYRRLANRVLAELENVDPIGAGRIRQTLAPGQHMGSVLESRVHRTAADFDPNTRFGSVMRLGQKIPGSQKAKQLWQSYYTTVFRANERFIEMPVQKQLLGKALVEELAPELKGRMRVGMKISDEIVNDLAKQAVDPAKAIRLAKVVEETTGQWTANSPQARYILSTFAPFGMWTRAATKYVLLTLPVHHPIKTAIMANIERMTQDEREALGLSFFADSPAPGNLRGAIPTPEGGVLPAANYSSFGYFADLPGALSTSVIPQYSGALKALAGNDPFGGDLENEDGTPMNEIQRFIYAARQLAGAYVPIVGKVDQISQADSVWEGLQKQVPFTNANRIDPSIYNGYLRELANQTTISVPAGGSSDSSSSSSSSSSSAGTTLEPWFDSPSSTSSTTPGTTLEPWFR